MAGMATTSTTVMTAIGMVCSADTGPIGARRHGPPLASPRRRVAHKNEENVQQQERHSVEEQACDDRRDRRAAAADEDAAGIPRPERVADTDRLAERHLGAPVDVLAGSGKVADGHCVAADPVVPADQAA